MRNLQKFLVLLLMLILPLQGIAAVFAPLHKAIGQTDEAMLCHPQHADHQTSDDASGDATRDTGATNHLCCHQVFTCTPSSVLNTPAQKFSDVSPFVRPLFTLFIPDSPDRPPRG